MPNGVLHSHPGSSQSRHSRRRRRTRRIQDYASKQKELPGSTYPTKPRGTSDRSLNGWPDRQKSRTRLRQSYPIRERKVRKPDVIRPRREPQRPRRHRRHRPKGRRMDIIQNTPIDNRETQPNSTGPQMVRARDINGGSQGSSRLIKKNTMHHPAIQQTLQLPKGRRSRSRKRQRKPQGHMPGPQLLGHNH